MRAVHAALDCGINYFDVAPAYGGHARRDRSRQGPPRASRATAITSRPRSASTRNPGTYGDDTLDYSRRASALRSTRAPSGWGPTTSTSSTSTTSSTRAGSTPNGRSVKDWPPLQELQARGPHRRGELRHLPDGPVAPHLRRLRLGRGPGPQPLLPERHALAGAAARRAGKGHRRHQRLAVRQRPLDRPRPGRLASRRRGQSGPSFGGRPSSAASRGRASASWRCSSPARTRRSRRRSSARPAPSRCGGTSSGTRSRSTRTCWRKYNRSCSR